MQIFLQAIGIALLASILTMFLKQSSPGISTLLSLAACTMMILFAITQLSALGELFSVLQQVSKLDDILIKPVIKAAGISIVAEIAELICSDSGNSAMGKTIQFAASAVIVCLAIPMITAFLELIEGILVGL